MLAGIPFIIAIVASGIIEPTALKFTTWIIGFILMSIIHVRWIPLEPR